MKTATKTLDQVKQGAHCTIKNIPANEIKAQTIRLGLTAGKKVLCQAVIPAGPVVIKINHQEIAIGRNLAKRIEVEEVSHATLS
ncbi:MAG: ferrous iron transport protein A [Firmicutes bacterium]|nr:ferrous iron transport protein A [Bacillota bacterium]